MRTPSQRRVLGVLFLVLALAFGGIAVAGATEATNPTGRVVIALTAGAIGLWLLGLALRSLRAR
jgi:TRAP-type C4-dicarboxylate transport system permease small subunit